MSIRVYQLMEDEAAECVGAFLVAVGDELEGNMTDLLWETFMDGWWDVVIRFHPEIDAKRLQPHFRAAADRRLKEFVKRVGELCDTNDEGSSACSLVKK